MNNINNKKLDVEKVGTVSVSIYKNRLTGFSSYSIDAENDDVIQVSYIIEDLLKMY